MDITDAVAFDPGEARKILKSRARFCRMRRSAANVRQAINLMSRHAVIPIAFSFRLSVL